jgi:tyrosyl-tRNA synthetase
MSLIIHEKGNIKENPILQFLKVVILPILNLKHGTTSFTVTRPEKWGGNSVYASFQEVETAFEECKLHPGDLKRAVTECLNGIMEPIRETFVKDKDLAALVERAYPSAKPKVVEEISRLDIRVGRIVEAELHPEASDRLVISKIDLGEKDGPRVIVSGLVGHVTPEELKDRLVLVVANLKPSNFKGGMFLNNLTVSVKSFGMVLCASSADKAKVQTLDPPVDATPGDLVVFEGYSRDVDEEKPLNPKLKVFEKASAHFRLEAGVAMFRDVAFSVEGKGECSAKDVSLTVIG